jgi:hopanoid biosynthesis associated RND transporter like protein HpnN
MNALINRSQNGLEPAISWWVSHVMRAPWLVIFLFLSLSIFAFYYTANNLTLNTDTGDMLSAELPFRQNYIRYKQLFPQYIDTMLVVIDGDTPESAQRAAQALAERVMADRALFKTVYRPGSGPFFDTNALLYLKLSELEDLTDSLSQIQPYLAKLTEDQSLRGLLAMTGEGLKAMQEGEKLELAPILRHLNESIEANLHGEDRQLSWQELMLDTQGTRENKRQFVVIQPQLDFSRWLPAQPGIEAVRRLADELQLDPRHGVKLRITGSLALEFEESQSVSQGAGVTALVALCMVFIVLWIGLRSLRLVTATLITLVTGLLLTAAFATAAVGELNLISVAFAILYIGLGVDFAIHLCLRYQELTSQAQHNDSALLTAAQSVGTSLVLCALTTAVGFYAFIFTDYEGVSELGLISGTGMFISLFANLSLLPALLTLRPLTKDIPDYSRPLPRAAEVIVRLPSRHPRVIIISAALLAVSALASLPWVSFDYNPLNLRNPDSESVSTFKDLIENSETPPWHATILARQDTSIADIVERLRTRQYIGQVITLEDFVPDRQEEKLDMVADIGLLLGPQLQISTDSSPVPYPQLLSALDEFIAILETYLTSNLDLPWRQNVARLRRNLERLRTQDSDFEAHERRLRRLEHGLLANLPDSLLKLQRAMKAHPVSLADLPENLSTRWLTPDNTQRIEVFPKEDISNNAALRRFVHDVRAVAPKATDFPVLSLESGIAIVKAFQQAFTAALIVIILLLLFELRRIGDTLMILIPLLLAGLCTAATTVLLNVPFNFANIIALPLLLGIGVDSGIHMVHRLRSPLPPEGHLLKTSTARAVLFSALTTIVSFGNLSFSNHPGTASLGLILTIGVLFTLVSTLVVLPALITQRQHHFEGTPIN